ncbi:protein kinase domain protein [Ichthyophthirius multifiliis]|uniref:Protein kinase domain protein n=1 Tax=Ichthyophthirius multifiliis TaxID=5932 RepID=G0QS16_ICHMU|nr:protein kinase domain protein [Ichthyophthirius multifiliis]EGR31985.1 protein kinase domain protein [Ichthyophthirius multifiliis]|eukprot:XP_004035471.1 protein kinase domain protein [Ichthyophthirius multifiliis]
MKNQTSNDNSLKSIEDSFFYDEFKNPSSFWQKYDFEGQQSDQHIILMGKLYLKSQKTKKWTAYHFELYSDKLIKIEIQNLIQKEYLQINSCFLKKIKYSENSYTNYKYGMRISFAEHKTELFVDNLDYFNNWYDKMKRYCILQKFSKKYKVLTKTKCYSHMPDSNFYYKCYRYSDSNQYCVRIIDKYIVSDQNKQMLLNEISILRVLNHNSLCKLYEIYEEGNNMFIIMDILLGKSLKSKLGDSIFADEKSVSEIIYSILSGLNYMHQKGIFHRDLKLDNLYFKNAQNLKEICISNFFTAEYYNDKQKQPFKKCGTAGFIAPEIFKTKSYDSKVDIFSLGVVFYILIFGKMPFNAANPDQLLLLNEICEIDFDTKDAAIKCSCSCIEILKSMLEKDPLKRPDSTQLIKHTWFINMKSRGEDGRMKNNYFGMPTLSTIQEKSSDLGSRQEVFSPRRTESGSKIYEEYNSSIPTLNQMMLSLNSNTFWKIPSKYRHDLINGQ